MPKNCIIITGGTRGIGLATAKRYSGSDVTIIVTYKENEASAKQASNQLSKIHKNYHVFQCDPANDASLSALGVFLKQNNFVVTSLINNQGSTRYSDKTIKQIDIDLVTEMLDKNLVNHLRMINLVLPYMVTGSSIVNVSSIAAINGKGSNIGYCAAKAALDSVTRSLAQSLGPDIRVNSICPGLTETEMTKKAPSSYITDQTKITPLNRLASAEDIANAIYSTTDVSTFINGQSIVIDGGRLLY
jgi:3-oxoacyl-[acyl-carrier protein] reductase